MISLMSNLSVNWKTLGLASCIVFFGSVCIYAEPEKDLFRQCFLDENMPHVVNGEIGKCCPYLNNVESVLGLTDYWHKSKKSIFLPLQCVPSLTVEEDHDRKVDILGEQVYMILPDYHSVKISPSLNRRKCLSIDETLQIYSVNPLFGLALFSNMGKESFKNHPVDSSLLYDHMKAYFRVNCQNGNGNPELCGNTDEAIWKKFWNMIRDKKFLRNIFLDTLPLECFIHLPRNFRQDITKAFLKNHLDDSVKIVMSLREKMLKEEGKCISDNIKPIISATCASSLAINIAPTGEGILADPQANILLKDKIKEAIKNPDDKPLKERIRNILKASSSDLALKNVTAGNATVIPISESKKDDSIPLAAQLEKDLLDHLFGKNDVFQMIMPSIMTKTATNGNDQGLKANNPPGQGPLLQTVTQTVTADIKVPEGAVTNPNEHNKGAPSKPVKTTAVFDKSFDEPQQTQTVTFVTIFPQQIIHVTNPHQGEEGKQPQPISTENVMKTVTFVHHQSGKDSYEEHIQVKGSGHPGGDPMELSQVEAKLKKHSDHLFQLKKLSDDSFVLIDNTVSDSHSLIMSKGKNSLVLSLLLLFSLIM